MSKGNKGGGGGGQGSKPGVNFNASHTMQNEGGLGDKVMGLIADSIGMIGFTIVSTLIYEAGKKALQKVTGGAQQALTSAASVVDDSGIRFGVQKSIEAVEEKEGRDLTVQDHKLVSQAYFAFPGNAGMESKKAEVNRIIAEELKG